MYNEPNAQGVGEVVQVLRTAPTRVEAASPARAMLPTAPMCSAADASQCQPKPPHGAPSDVERSRWDGLGVFVRPARRSRLGRPRAGGPRAAPALPSTAVRYYRVPVVSGVDLALVIPVRHV